MERGISVTSLERKTGLKNRKNECGEYFPGLVFHEYIYRREEVMPRIHSHLRSGRRRSLQVPNLRTSKDYLYRRVSGQKFLLANEFATSVSDYEFLVYRRKERGICNVISV